MPLPQIDAPVFFANPLVPVIDLDPGVPTKYVLPVEGATSVGFQPDANFTVTVSGRTLTVTYVGGQVHSGSTPPQVPLQVWASNAAGTTTQTINFRINWMQNANVSTSPVLLQITAGTADITTIAGVYVVGDVFQGLIGSGFPSTSPYYVVYASGTVIRLSATSGGSAITPTWSRTVSSTASSGGAAREIVLTSGSANVTVNNGGVSGLSVGDTLLIASGLGTVPTGDVHFDGVAVFIISISGSTIQVSATSGGSALTFTPTQSLASRLRLLHTGSTTIRATQAPVADGTTVLAYGPAPFTGVLIANVVSGGITLKPSGGSPLAATADLFDDFPLDVYARKFLSITSAETATGTAGSAIASYTLTTDVTADNVFAEGLPDGLSINTAGVISGTPTANGFYLVTLIAYKGIYKAVRYLLVTIGAAAATSAAVDIFRRRIRMAFDLRLTKNVKDVITAASPLLPLGGDVQIEAALFDNGALVTDLTNLASVTLNISRTDKASIDGTPDITKTLTSGSMNNALTLDAWNAGASADCHFLIVLTGAETNLNEALIDTPLHLVLYGITTDVPSQRIPFGESNPTLHDYGLHATGTPQTNADLFYDAAASDARYARLTVAGKFRFKTDGTFQLWNADQSLFFSLGVAGALGAEVITIAEPGEA